MCSSIALLALCLAWLPLTAPAQEAASGLQFFGLTAEVNRVRASAAGYRKQGEYAKAEAILAEEQIHGFFPFPQGLHGLQR